MQRSASLVGLIAGALLLGCAAAEERYCKLSESRAVASTESKVIDGVALVAHGEGAVLAWSDASGTFARELDAQGKPAGAATRLMARCDGGVALASSRAGLALACVERAKAREIGEPGSAIVASIARGQAGLVATELKRYAPAGTLSEGVALAWTDPQEGRGRPQLALAWHDASPDVHRIQFVGDVHASASPRVLSNIASVAYAPALIAEGEEILATFHERIARGGALESNVMLWSNGARSAADQGPAVAIVSARDDTGETQPIHPFPQLAMLDGQLVLGYRAPGRGARKPGLHVTNVESALAGAPPKVHAGTRVGRADGVGRPTLLACMDGFVTATPRSYSGDYFIGLNWLSRDFTRPRREQQFYEDARAFTQAASACLGPRALIALAELPQLDRAQAELHVAAYTCE